MMSRKPHTRRFNMIEIVITLVIILIALVSILSLLPKSIQSTSEATGRIAAGDAADQLLNYLSVRVSGNWEDELAAFPATRTACADEDGAIWSMNAKPLSEGGGLLLANTDTVLEFNSINEASGYTPSAVHGLYRISHRTGESLDDYQAVVRVWCDLDVPDADAGAMTHAEQIAAATAVKLNAEVSWPSDIPYALRKRAFYSLTVFRPVASAVAASDADLCVKSGELAGTANLNPGNNPDFSFEARTTGGQVITRDTLHSRGSGYSFYGTLTYIRFCPKSAGSGTSTLKIDGEAYAVNNAKCYTVNGDAIHVRIWNDKSGTGTSMGHWLMDISPSGAVIEGICGDDVVVDEEEEDDDDLFEIVGGEVIPIVPVKTTFEVLGCALTSNKLDCYVTASLTIDKTVQTPFGSTSVTVANGVVSAPGNLNDGVKHSFDAGILQGGTRISVTGFSYWPNGTFIMEQSSVANQNVLVLRDGDPVPNIKGFDGQDSLELYIQGHIDTEKKVVTIESNQAILLFELGTTNLNSTAADFQDMVMLVTMTPEG